MNTFKSKISQENYFEIKLFSYIWDHMFAQVWMG